MKFYTYCHTRNDNGKIFYIGLGSGNRRYKSITNRNKHWHNIVNKAGFSHEILAFWKNREEAASHEIVLISSFRDMGYELANKSSGGELSALGMKHSSESRKKISLALKGKPHSKEHNDKVSIAKKGKNHHMYGKHLSKEHKEKLSIAGSKRVLSEEHKLKIGNANKVRVLSKETRKKMSESAKLRCLKKSLGLSK